MPLPVDSSSRSRMPVACAECRRLKLKCDKNQPCSSCLRRGCASICPQGRMVPKGSRFILADTERLHEKIDALICRVRQLEIALETSHSLHSRETHPLLEEELRLIAAPIEPVMSASDHAGKVDELADSLGTLSLEKSGTQYFGTTGAYAFLWRDNDDPDGAVYQRRGDVSLALADIPAEIAHLAHAFPIRLPMFDVSHLGTWMLENCLPPFPEAWSLVENYWEHLPWQFTPMTRPWFVKRIFSPLYHRSQGSSDSPLGHRLGLLLMVFAIGDLLDLTQPWVSSRGLRYYLLARASLCIDPVLESPTVTALQAMHLMSIFFLMSRGTNEPENAWVLSGINIKLALTLGLQHDANKFNLPLDEVENRRDILVSVLFVEIWQALCVGRLPSQSFANFDWVSNRDNHSDTEQESPYSPARQWMARFMRDCSCKVLETVVGNKATNYSSILQLDAQIREYPLLDLPCGNSEGPEGLGMGTTMLRGFLHNVKDISLSYLHRHCFALALRDYPEDPLKSPFAPSVMVCHRIAIAYISRIGQLHSTLPALSVRIWFIWPHVFVSTLILGSIVARSPGCSLALSSLLCLEKVSQLWETASESVCGGKVLEVVRRLKQKAFMAFTRSKAPGDIHGAAPRGVEVVDEIHALGGYGPRVISTVAKSASSTPSPYAPEPRLHSDSSQSPPSSNPSDPPSSNPPDAPSNNPSDLPFSLPPDPPPIKPSDNYIPQIYNPNVDVPSAAPPAVVDSLPSAFDWTEFDYSSYLPVPSANELPPDFDVFAALGDPAPQPPPTPGPNTLLEQLGLAGEWQPVMDYLDL
ncbi:hypothetical protein JB92DRAFT_2923771 [Gautieria morchelliformis]|nr:hypothetical protein JB92DRAFT_2923771 [Gautieria morchelliformis]